MRIEAPGRRIFVSHADASRPVEMHRLADDAVAMLGRIDVLVNNAGFGRHRSIEEITVEDFDRMFEIHVKGSLFCGQAVMLGITERRSGSPNGGETIVGF